MVFHVVSMVMLCLFVVHDVFSEFSCGFYVVVHIVVPLVVRVVNFVVVRGLPSFCYFSCGSLCCCSCDRSYVVVIVVGDIIVQVVVMFVNVVVDVVVNVFKVAVHVVVIV